MTRNYNAVDLRSLELRYFISCYGICFIPALIYLILDESRLKTGIYGDAVVSYLHAELFICLIEFSFGVG